MIIESYKRFFSAVHYANERDYENSFILADRILEELDWYDEYHERHQISEKSKVYKELQVLKEFSNKQVRFILLKSKVKLVFLDI